MLLTRISFRRLVSAATTRTLASTSTRGFHHVADMTETQTELKEMAEKFCNEEIAPIADKIDKEDKFDRSLWNKMGE